MTKRNTQRAEDLLERYLNRECSPEEEAIVEKWYDNLALDQQDTTEWAAASMARFLDDRNPKPARSVRFRPLKWIAAAAVVLLTAGAGFYWLQHTPASGKISSITYSAVTGAAALKQVVLPDSTIVWLNANSTLHWTDAYKHGNRYVSLEGEASFDVRHDTEHPFVVHTADADIRVLGTCFNVATGHAGLATEVALLRGKVAVKLNDQQQERLVLLPGEMALCVANTGTLSKEQADVQASFSWMSGGFSARDMALKQVLEKLCAKYGYTLQWKDLRGGHKHISVTFAAQSFNSMLESLCFVNHLHYTIHGHTIVIQ